MKLNREGLALHAALTLACVTLEEGGNDGWTFGLSYLTYLHT